MEKVGKAIVKLRIPILILSVLLLIPAGIGLSLIHIWRKSRCRVIRFPNTWILKI